ncbi:hypothetical protein D3C72_2337570 [compost metagenome]
MALVQHVVTTSKGYDGDAPRYLMAFINEHYPKVWSKVGAHLGVTGIDGNMTRDRFKKAIEHE